MSVYVLMCMYMQVHLEAKGSPGAAAAERQLWDAIWGMGTEPRFSARALRALSTFSSLSLIFFFFSSETGFLYVALAVLELTLQTGLASYSQRSASQVRGLKAYPTSSSIPIF